VLVLVYERVAVRRLGLRQCRRPRNLKFELPRGDVDQDGLTVAQHHSIAVNLNGELSIERRQRAQIRLRRPLDASGCDSRRIPAERSVWEPLEAACQSDLPR
jgi:hypothetical protein